MRLMILLGLMIALDLHAFILVDKDYRLSNPEKTSVTISSNGCSGNGISLDELEKVIKASIEMWNDVPESRLRLKFGGMSGTLVTSTTIPAGEIVVGCDSLASSIGGVANLDMNNGSARIRLNSNYFVAGGYTYEGLAGVLIHELGHGIGLNHSKDRASVMTYESSGWKPMPSYLSQDDVDGVTYLYPNEKSAGGLLGSCNSFSSDNNSETNDFNVISNLFTGLIFALLVRFIFNRIKAIMAK